MVDRKQGQCMTATGVLSEIAWSRQLTVNFRLARHPKSPSDCIIVLQANRSLKAASVSVSCLFCPLALLQQLV